MRRESAGAIPFHKCVFTLLIMGRARAMVSLKAAPRSMPIIADLRRTPPTLFGKLHFFEYLALHIEVG